MDSQQPKSEQPAQYINKTIKNILKQNDIEAESQDVVSKLTEFVIKYIYDILTEAKGYQQDNSQEISPELVKFVIDQLNDKQKKPDINDIQDFLDQKNKMKLISISDSPIKLPYNDNLLIADSKQIGVSKIQNPQQQQQQKFKQ